MSDFITLKDACAKKLEEARNLQKALSTKLIIRDLTALVAEMPDRLKKVDQEYILDDKISIYVREDGCLDIIDDRATAFGWLFELEFMEALRTGDAFKYEDKIYIVSQLNEYAFDGICDEIQKVIAEVDAAITNMRTKTDLNKWSYKYYDCHEDVHCENLNEVVSVVVDRKPVFR